MKRTIILVLFSAYILSLFATGVFAGAEKKVIIKEVWEDAFFSKIGGKRVEGNRVVASETTFDHQGRTTGKIEYYYDKGTFKSVTVYSYDNRGRVTEWSRYKDKARTKLDEKAVYTYYRDNKEPTSYITTYDDGVTKLRHRYSYDYYPSGRLKKKITESYSPGKGTVYYITQYDSNGRETETYFCHDGKNYELSITFKYDGNGNLTEEICYGSNGKPWLWYNYKYKYDKEKRIAKKQSLTYETDWRTKRKYKSDDRWEYYEYNSTGELTKKTTYDWDILQKDYVILKNSYRTVTYAGPLPESPATTASSEVPYRISLKVADVNKTYQPTEYIIGLRDEPEGDIDKSAPPECDILDVISCHDSDYLRFDVFLAQPVSDKNSVTFGFSFEYSNKNKERFSFAPWTGGYFYCQEIDAAGTAGKRIVLEQPDYYAGLTADQKSIIFIVPKKKHFSGEKGKKYYIPVTFYSNFTTDLFTELKGDETITVNMEYER